MPPGSRFGCIWVQVFAHTSNVHVSRPLPASARATSLPALRSNATAAGESWGGRAWATGPGVSGVDPGGQANAGPTGGTTAGSFGAGGAGVTTTSAGLAVATVVGDGDEVAPAPQPASRPTTVRQTRSRPVVPRTFMSPLPRDALARRLRTCQGGGVRSGKRKMSKPIRPKTVPSGATAASSIHGSPAPS